MIDRQELLTALRDPHIIEALHRLSDSDRGRLSQHHTLGQKPNQAAAGNHTHASSGGGGGETNLIDDIANWTAAIGYDEEFNEVTGNVPGSTLPTGWSWVNQGSATFRQAFGIGSLNHPGAGSDDVKAIVRAVPSENTFSAYAKLSAAGNSSNFTSVGLVLRDSISGKMIIHSIYRTGGTYGIENWNSPTAFSSGFSQSWLAPCRYARLRKNGAWSDVDFSVSQDGATWYDLGSHGNVAGFITPDQIGMFVHRSVNTPTAGGIDWFRVR